MDEKVVFDNTKDQQQPAETPPDATQAPSQPAGEAGSAEAIPPGGTSSEVPPEGAPPEAPPSDVPPADVPPEAPPPPPSGPLGGGLVKKVIIGVVIFIVIIFLIFLFLPKREAVRNVTLQWWGLWEDSSVTKELIDDFHRQHPNITIEYTKQDPANYGARLMTKIKNGTGPDIFRFHNSWYPMLSDLLLPLPTDVITPEDFQNSYYPVMQLDLVQNGAIYGIPLEADSLALFVNTDLLEECKKSSYPEAAVPVDWLNFQKVAQNCTVIDSDTNKIKVAGAAFGTYGNITHASDIISLLFVQEGADLKKFSSSTQDEIDALEFYGLFSRKENTGKGVWDDTLAPSFVSFAKGQVIMYFGYSWDIFEIQKLNKNLNFSIYPVPQIDPDKKKTIASYWVEGVSAKSKNRTEAFQFMKYLASKEASQKFYTSASKTRSFGELYARRDLRDSLKNNKLVYPFLLQMDYATSTIFSSNTHDGEAGLNTKANNYLENTINAINKDGTSTDTAIQTLQQAMVQDVFSIYNAGE